MSDTLKATLERVSVGSEALDALIAKKVGWTNFEQEPGYEMTARMPPEENTLGQYPIPDFTASRDAARTLVPKRHSYASGSCGENNIPWACVTQESGDRLDFSAEHTVEEIALCIAALDALANTGGQS